MRHVVVVGHGMVGSRFAELLVEADPRGAGHGARQGAGRRLQPRAALERRRRAARAPGCSGWPVRRTRASRSSPASGPRPSTGTAGSSSTTAAASTGTTTSSWRRARPRGCPRSRASRTTRDSSTGVFVLKDMADATGIVAGRRQRPAGGRPRRRRARRGGRHRPGEAWPQRPDRPPRRPPHGAPARLGGVAGRDHQPGAARHHDPRRGLRRRRQRPAAAGSRASASPTASRRRPTSSSCAAAPSPRRCSPAGPASPSTGASSSPTTSRAPTTRTCTPSATAPSPRPARTGLVAQGWQQAAALVATLAPGAASPSTGSRDPRRRPGQGVRDVDGEHGRLRGLRPQRPPLPRRCPSRTPSAVATWRSWSRAATSSARRASVTRRSRPPCRRSTPARCRSPTTPRSSW